MKSAVSTMEKAKQNALLWFGEILERKLYLYKGYSTIHQYAEQELGYTNALEILKVTNEENQGQWLAVALNNSRRELAREVKRAKQDAADKDAGQPLLIPETKRRSDAVVPVRVGLEMSPTQFARYEALWEKFENWVACRRTGSRPCLN